jgi:putative solute:sodium symporter small subunit
MPARDSLLFNEQQGAPFAPDLHDARHLWLKAALLLAWALVSFGTSFFARDLQFPVGHWLLSYWIASQGAVLAFLLIACVYCLAMNRFERQDEAAAPAPDAAGQEPPPHG